MRDILLEIAEKSARGLEVKKAARPEAELLKAIERRERRPLSLYSALKREGVSVIAEIKKASPSKGIIKADLDPLSFAKIYSENGAAAISVLTEENYFLGSLDVLKAVREVTELPLLRKDFIIDRYQVLEAAAAGADALLLIAALLNDKLLRELFDLTHKFGLEALCEAHTEEEAKCLTDLGAKVIGVNCRDLRTFQVNLMRSRKRMLLYQLLVLFCNFSTRQNVLKNDWEPALPQVDHLTSFVLIFSMRIPPP